MSDSPTRPHGAPARLAKSQALHWTLEGLLGLGLAWFVQSRLGWHLPGLNLLVLPIVFLAARYGFWAGLCSGLAAGVLDLVLTAGSQLANPWFWLDDRHTLALPAACVALGVLLGEVRQFQIGNSVRKAREQDELTERYLAISDRYEIVLRAKEELDRHIVGQTQTVMALYEAARDLEILEDRHAIAPAALKLLETFVAATAGGLYFLDGAVLRLESSIGSTALPEALPVEGSILGMVVGTRRTFALKTKGEFEQGPFLMAAPLFDNRGQVMGVLAVSAMPFTRLTPSSERLVGMLAEWTGRAIAKARDYEDSQILDPRSQAYTVRYMRKRLSAEVSLARRYDLPLSLLLVRLDGLLALPTKQQDSLLAKVAGEILQRIRNVDLLCRWTELDTLVIILPVTGADGAKVLQERLLAVISTCCQEYSPLVPTIAAVTLDPKTPQTAEQLLLRAEWELSSSVPHERAVLLGFFAALARLEPGPADELLPAALDLLTLFLGVSGAAYRFASGKLSRIALMGPDLMAREELPLDGPLKEILAVGEPAMYDWAEGRSGIVLPLQGEGGRFDGVILLASGEREDAAELNRRTLGWLSDWLSSTAWRFGANDRESWLAPQGFSSFLKRLRESHELARRDRLPLSLLFVRLPDAGSITAQEAAMQRLGSLLLNMLRSTDLVGRYLDEDAFVAILQVTDLAAASALCARLKPALEKVLGFAGPIEIAVGQADDCASPFEALQTLVTRTGRSLESKSPEDAQRTAS